MVSNKLNETGVQKVVTCASLCSLTRQRHDLELLASRWSSETHTSIAAKELTSTLEDVSRLTLLPIFREANAMWIVLEEEDQLN